MRVRFTPRALREAERKKEWWRENRDESALFDDELAETLKQIAETPTLGSFVPSGLDVPIRRVLMTKTANHLYFTSTEAESVVLAVWGAARRRRPKLTSG